MTPEPGWVRDWWRAHTGAASARLVFDPEPGQFDQMTWMSPNVRIPIVASAVLVVVSIAFGAYPGDHLAFTPRNGRCPPRDADLAALRRGAGGRRAGGAQLSRVPLLLDAIGRVAPRPGYGRPMDNGLAALLGIEVADTEPDRAVVELDADERHLNHHGTVHGGAIATMVDSAMGAAVRREDTHDEAPVTIEMKVTYLRPAHPGRLRAEAAIRRRGKRIVIAEVDVLDADGEAVAHGIGTFTSVSS